MSRLALVLLAAGRSTRFGDPVYKKPLAPLAGRAVWLHSVERFQARSDLKQTIVVVASEDREEFTRRFGANLAILGIDLVDGGDERADSVAAGLARVSDAADLVAVHDAARPCVTDKEIDLVVAAARRHGAAILATPVAGTLKRVAGGGDAARVEATVPRAGLWEAQTPQVFRRDWLVEAYAQPDRSAATDDAQLLERLGKPVAVVEGRRTNLKITTKPDLRLAEQILKSAPPTKPTGGMNPFAGDDLWR